MRKGRLAIGDQLEVLVLGDAEGAVDMEVPSLAEDGAGRGACLNQGEGVGIAFHRVLGETGGAEGGGVYDSHSDANLLPNARLHEFRHKVLDVKHFRWLIGGEFLNVLQLLLDDASPG